jgi:REP element-mobilizing transposase RayT
MPDKPKYNPNIHHRRSIRLKGYDYTQAGLYFITICCQDRACLFGKIENGEMILNNAGKMVETEWLKLRERFKNIELHEFVIMPNHFHAILEIVRATLVVAPNADLIAPNVDLIAPNVNLIAPNANLIASNANLIASNVDLIAPNVDVVKHDGEITKPQNGQPRGIAPAEKTVGNMLGAFQSIVTVEYIRGVKNIGWKPFNGKLWQRNYYEIIIRNEQSYQNISKYIINNPAKWAADKFYLKRIAPK